VSTNIGIRSVYLFSLQLPVGASGGRGSGGEHCHLGTIFVWIDYLPGYIYTCGVSLLL